MTDQIPDRYVTFRGIDCDGRAARLLALLADRMGEADSPWVPYFQRKLAEKRRIGNDDLHFAGSQINMLRAFFEEAGDEAALELLWHLEQDCC